MGFIWAVLSSLGSMLVTGPRGCLITSAVWTVLLLVAVPTILLRGDMAEGVVAGSIALIGAAFTYLQARTFEIYIRHDHDALHVRWLFGRRMVRWITTSALERVGGSFEYSVTGTEWGVGVERYVWMPGLSRVEVCARVEAMRAARAEALARVAATA